MSVFYPAARAGKPSAGGWGRRGPGRTEAAFVRTRPTLRGAFTVGGSPFEQHACDRPRPRTSARRRSGYLTLVAAGASVD
jgi:hypothetical protein